MPFLPADERFLHRALELAEAAAAFASPNPTVGCVLTQGDSPVAEGAHHYEQRDHAEITALKRATAAGQRIRGATAYVTLEPCSHHGRTGPCADALIAAGIARCVVATVDPNPLVSGQGLAKLRAGDVAVDLLKPAHPLANRARRLNDAFAFSIQNHRPFVTLKAATSADGMLAPASAHRSGRVPHWLTGPAAQADVQQLRHRADALLTGIGTILADDPELTDRTGAPRRRPLWRLILDSGLRLPLDSRLVRTAQDGLLVLTTERASEERAQALRGFGVGILRLPTNGAGIDLKRVFAALAEMAVRSVLVEGGSALNGGLLRDGLADRVVLYEAPSTLGPGALPLAQGGPTPETLLAQLSSVEQARFPHGDAADVRTTGYLHDPWAEV